MKATTPSIDTINVPTILIAEDDELVRQITEETLRAAGMRVISVHDGQEAQEALKEVRPDLILSDVRMPRCDGFELLRRVRRDPEQERTPFIIMSAKAETADQRMGMSLGADDYVVKPYDPDDLLKAIEVRLRRAAAINDILKEQHRFLMRVLPHELRSPLTVIIGYADLMINMGKCGEFLKPEDMVDYGQHIERSGARLLRMANDLSLWSWLEAKDTAVRLGIAPQLEPQFLTASMINRWCEDVATTYSRPIDYTLDAVDGRVMAPPLGLERVISHILDNAFKFSLPSMTVQVSARHREGTYEIVVTDLGRGMSDDELAKISVMRQFGRDRFEQQGIGMGLVLARNFARIAGGSFSLERNAIGVGLTAKLSLPSF